MNRRSDKKLGMFDNVLRVLSFLSDKSRQRLRLLVGFMFVGALAEIINIGALLPFLAILASPQNFGGAFSGGVLVLAQNDTVTVMDVGTVIANAKAALREGS